MNKVSRSIAKLTLLIALAITATSEVSGAEVSPARAVINVDVSSKIDVGLDDLAGNYAVFIRMADQLIAASGDYERFCEEHRESHRRELRPQVISTLQNKADTSWQQVAELVSDLE